MTTFERIKKLSEERGETVKTVGLKLKLGENAFYKWKTSSPSIEKIKTVADYFGVSVDYLLCRTDDPHSDKKGHDRELTIQEALDSVMSYDGKPLSDNDREVLKRITEAYLDGKI